MKNEKALSVLANCLKKLENLSTEEVEAIRKEKNINEYDFEVIGHNTYTFNLTINKKIEVSLEKSFVKEQLQVIEESNHIKVQKKEYTMSNADLCLSA